jgi:hypothetical protein
MATRSWLTACLAAFLSAAGPTANAQSVANDPFALQPAAGRFGFADRTGPMRLGAAFEPAHDSGARWLSSTIELDRPRAAANGTYTRPKLMVGLPSAPMRNWLRAAGVEAERCQLPMLRARTSMASGDLNGTLWLFARCSFH